MKLLTKLDCNMENFNKISMQYAKFLQNIHAKVDTTYPNLLSQYFYILLYLSKVKLAITVLLRQSEVRTNNQLNSEESL